MDIDLTGKSRNDIIKLLKVKYPNPPRYINLTEFKNHNQPAGDAIETVEWKFVTPGYVGGKYTGYWVDVGSGSGGIINNDEFIKELLLNTSKLEKAELPTNGGRRRAQRKTKVKSKKRANKRRTRSRK